MAKLNEKGHEILDQTPLALPVRVQRTIGIDRQHSYHIQYDTQEDYESPEEADDFDCGDDFDPSVPWENQSPHEEQNRNMILEQARKEFDSRYSLKKSSSPSEFGVTEESLDSRSASVSAQGSKSGKGKIVQGAPARIRSSLPEESDSDKTDT